PRGRAWEGRGPLPRRLPGQRRIAGGPPAGRLSRRIARRSPRQAAAGSAGHARRDRRRHRLPQRGRVRDGHDPRDRRRADGGLMQALVTEPGRAGSARVEALPEPIPQRGEVAVRVLEVGVCGTDREIAHGHFGVAPEGESTLVLGHELLGTVDRDGRGFSRGDLVAAIVRRSCGHCPACAEDSPDSCLSGDYLERGITRLDCFARELIAERASQLIPVPPTLGRLGVLGEPTSICTRALRHARTIGGRQPWQLERALVLGAGAIGLLTTILLRLEGIEVWTASL